MNKEPYYDSLPQDAKDWLDEHREEIDQDHVVQRELCIGLSYADDDPVTFPEPTYLTPREKEIVTLLGKGLTRADVCQVLDITVGALRINLFRLKKKCNGLAP